MHLNRAAYLRALALFSISLLSCCTSASQLTTVAATTNNSSGGRQTNYIPRGGNAYQIARAISSEEQTVAQPTFFDGTGQFLGEKPTGSIAMPPAKADDGITLNLAGVPISQAAKTVLGDILGIQYTVDPSLQGQITIQTPNPVSKKSAFELFQSALRSNNAAIIFTANTYKVVPIDQATAGASIDIEGESGPDQTLGSGLHVVQLKYVSASELRRIIEPISPRGAVVAIDNARNTITLSGSDQDISGMLDAISIFDVDVMKGMSFGIVPVKTSQPDAIADELTTIFSSDKEGPMSGMVKFLPNSRLGAILIITPQKAYLSRAASWIKRLDAQAAGSEKQFYTYSVQNRRAKELVDVLQSMFSDGRSTDGSSSTRNIAPQYQASSVQSPALQPAALSSGNPFSAQTGTTAASNNSQGIGSSDTTSSAGPSSTGLGGTKDSEPRIKVVADDSKNAILIEATADDYRRVMRVITALDTMPNQVLIEATIAEISLKDELKFGLRWYLQNHASNVTLSDDLSGAVSSVFPGFSYALKATNIAATLNALNQITDVNVISSPSLTVADNKTASLQIGDQVPITTQSAVSVLTPGAPVVNSVSYKDTGVILSITPQINESGRVMLDIQQEVSTVGQTTSSSIDSPTISERKVKTSVVVNDGEAFALGGMIQTSKTNDRAQLPVLGDLPIIGNAFGAKDNLVDKTELIVLIAPHVIRNVNEARQITDEFRREMAIDIPYEQRQPHTLEQTVHRLAE